MVHYWDRVRRAQRDGGLRLVVRKALGTMVCDVVLYALDLERELPVEASEERLVGRPLAEADLGAYFELRPDEDVETVRARFGRGDLCFGTWDDGRLVGAAWVRFDRVWVSQLGKALPLRMGEAYGYDSYTDPRARRQGAATIRSAAIIRHLQGLGHRRLVAYMVRENAPSRRALEKLGFVLDGRIRWFHVGRYGVAVHLRDGRLRTLAPHVRPDELRE